MEKHTIFDREEQVIEEGKRVVGDPQYREERLFEAYSGLLDEYKRLKNDFSRVLKITDRQQLLIKGSEDSLKVEVEKRKLIEQQLLENEVKLIKAKNVAEDALETKSRFLATMSHEIRTPLNGIIGGAALLKRHLSDSNHQEYIDIILSSGDILLSLINDILDFSKVESNNLELESLPLDLENCIESTLEVVAAEVLVKKLDLIFERDEQPFPEILGDKVRITQILVNLINNAVKFTRQGQVTVSLREQGRKDGKIKVYLEVKDTGIGIQSDRQSPIFDAFCQVDASTTRRFGGTGLGLSICKKLVELFEEGQIGVESTLGEGATFHVSFWIPLSPKTDQQEKTPHFDAGAKEEEEVNDKGQRTEILLVEDHVINQKIAIATFNLLGYQVDLAEDGLEALEAVKVKDYDLIFMDIQMPQMDGLEATQKIRQLDCKQPIIIAMTANTGREYQEEAYQNGMDDFISKPVIPETLSLAIDKWKKADSIEDKSMNQLFQLIPWMDDHRLQQLGVDYDSGLLKDIFHRFRQDLTDSLQQLMNLTEQGAWLEYRQLSHKLKGACLNLGASRLSKVFAYLDELVECEESQEQANIRKLDEFTMQLRFPVYETIRRLQSKFLRELDNDKYLV